MYTFFNEKNIYPLTIYILNKYIKKMQKESVSVGLRCAKKGRAREREREREREILKAYKKMLESKKKGVNRRRREIENKSWCCGDTTRVSPVELTLHSPHANSAAADVSVLSEPS